MGKNNTFTNKKLDIRAKGNEQHKIANPEPGFSPPRGDTVKYKFEKINTQTKRQNTNEMSISMTIANRRNITTKHLQPFNMVYTRNNYALLAL